MSSAFVLDCRVPSGGFSGVLDYWRACHQRAERCALLLAQLAEHWSKNGPSQPAAVTARDVLRYFREAAPKHMRDKHEALFQCLEVPAVAVEQLREGLARLEQRWRDAEPAVEHCVEKPIQETHRQVILRFVDAWLTQQAAEEQLLDRLDRSFDKAAERCAVHRLVELGRDEGWFAPVARSADRH